MNESINLDLEKLKKQYPKKFTPNVLKKYIAYCFGFVLLLEGVLIFLGTIAAVVLKPDVIGVAPIPIGLIAGVAIGYVGKVFLKYAPRYKFSTPFADECQNIINEIRDGNFSHKNETEYADCQNYSLDDLIEIYNSINREHLKQRFETVAYLLQSKLTSA